MSKFMLLPLSDHSLVCNHPLRFIPMPSSSRCYINGYIMVNGFAFMQCFSSLLTNQCALQYLSHLPTHTRVWEWVNGTSTQMSEAAKQFGVQYLDQGYFDLQGGASLGFGPRPSDWWMTCPSSEASAAPMCWTDRLINACCSESSVSHKTKFNGPSTL